MQHIALGYVYLSIYTIIYNSSFPVFFFYYYIFTNLQKQISIVRALYGNGTEMAHSEKPQLKASSYLPKLALPQLLLKGELAPGELLQGSLSPWGNGQAHSCYGVAGGSCGHVVLAHYVSFCIVWCILSGTNLG